MAEVRHVERSMHLSRILEEGKRPVWSVNCGTWPDQILSTDEKYAFVELHKQHAKERVEMLLTILDRKVEIDRTQFSAYFRAFRTYCQENNLENDFEIANRVMERLAKEEKQRNLSSYNKKEENLPQPTWDNVWRGLTSVARTDDQSGARPRRNRSRSRSRSRSPAGGNRGGRTPNPQFQRGRGRGRWRSSSRGRGNFRGRPNQYGRRAPNGGMEVTKLTTEEAAIVLALREQRS